MKKLINWIILIMLIIAVGVLLFFLIKTVNEKNTLSNTMNDFKNSTIATQVAESQASQNALTSFEVKQTALQNQFNALQNQLENEQSKYDTLLVENVDLNETLYCADKASFTPDYASNMAMSVALKAYESTITGLPIQDAVWEVIWSGTNTSFHEVFIYKENKRFKAPYIVFFIEQGMNLKRGVFDITNQCWLDYE